jgi:hypothetical protein
MIEYLFHTEHGIALFFLATHGGRSQVLTYDLNEAPIAAKVSFLLAADDTSSVVTGALTCCEFRERRPVPKIFYRFESQLVYVLFRFFFQGIHLFNMEEFTQNISGGNYLFGTGVFELDE